MAATATAPAHRQPAIERASATDRAILAMDAGDVPEQLAVILVLEQAGGLDVQRVRELIAGRLPAIPRLRQRLSGCRSGAAARSGPTTRGSTSEGMSARRYAPRQATSGPCWTSRRLALQIADAGFPGAPRPSTPR